MKSEIEYLYEVVGICLKDKWGDSTSNKLSLTCLYSLNIFSDEDLIYWKTAKLVNKLATIATKANDNKITTLISENCMTKLISAIYCILASNQTIYNLPSMLNLSMKHGKITTHILFGDALANLSAIALVAESYKLLLELETTINKSELITVLNNQISDFRIKSNLINLFPNSNNDLLETDYLSFQKILLENTIISILLLRSYPNKNILDVKPVITTIVNSILQITKTRNITSIGDEDLISIFTKEQLFSLLYSPKVGK